MPSNTQEQLWQRACQGQRQAVDALLAQSYQELRVIARRVLQGDGPPLGIQPTDLAHEAAIRLMKLNRIDFSDRTHFLAMSARIMRQALLDEVRRIQADKRGGDAQVVTLWPDAAADTARALPLEALDQALSRLASIDGERARIVELRFFGGLTIEEVAQTLGLSERTAKRRWASARAWLLAALGEGA